MLTNNLRIQKYLSTTDIIMEIYLVCLGFLLTQPMET